MTISDDCRVELFPVLVHEAGEGNFRVIRWGGRSRIATRAAGVEAIRIFRKGATVRQVKEALARQYGRNPSDVVITALLESLQKANLIRRLGAVKTKVPTGEFTIRTLLRFSSRFYLAPALRKLAFRFPLKLRRWTIFWVDFWDMKRTFRPKLLSAAQNLALSMPDKSSAEIHDVTRTYYRHLIQNIVDVETVMTLSPLEIDRFLIQSVRCQGVEHLNRALLAGKGAILCGFHFTSTSLMPAALVRRGYSLTTMGTTAMEWGLQKTMAKIEAVRKQMPGYGSLSIVDNYSFESLNQVMRLLKHNGIVICLPDVYSVAVYQDSETRERSRFFRLARPEFPRSQIRVPFLGVSVSMNEWAGWLAGVTGAALLPALVIRHGPNDLEFRIEQPVNASRNSIPLPTHKVDLRDHLNRAVYRVLEEYAKEYPAQWFGWHNLHKLDLEVGGPGAKSEATCAKSFGPELLRKEASHGSRASDRSS